MTGYANVTGMNRTLISGPPIGCLCRHTRKWAHEHLRRGSFGPVTVGPGGVLYADLANVEAYAGVTFSAEQLEQAVAGHRGRILQIKIEDAA